MRKQVLTGAADPFVMKWEDFPEENLDSITQHEEYR